MRSLLRALVATVVIVAATGSARADDEVRADDMTPLRSQRSAAPNDTRPVPEERTPRGACRLEDVDRDAFACAEAYLRWVERLPAERCAIPLEAGPLESCTPEGAARPEPGYRFAAEHHARIAARVRATPGLLVPFVVGETLRGRPIWAYRLQAPGRRVTTRLLIVANLHAMEWVPTEIAVDALLEATSNPPPGVSWTVIPTLNPDGRARVELDVRRGDDRFRRGNAANVDLNRDFAENRDSPTPFRWTMPWRYGSSPGPLSQPESRALDALAAAVRFDAAVSLHAFGGYAFYPWAGLWERPADWKELHAMAVTLQSGMATRPYRPKQLSRFLFTFVGQGMEIDHLYRRYGTKAILVEATRSGLSPWRPREWTGNFRLYNPYDPRTDVQEGAAALRALAWSLRDDKG